MKTKILFILDNMQPGDGERALVRIINGLSRESYELCLAYHKGSDLGHAIQNDVECIPLDFSKKFNPALVFKLAGIIKRNRARIIHAYGARADFHGRLARMLSGRTRYVLTIAMPDKGPDAGGARKRQSGFLDRIYNLSVDRFIAPSDLISKRICDMGAVNPDKVVRIYNGVDTDSFQPSPEDRDRIRAEFNIPRDTVLIGAAGRLVWQKGFEFLIKSIPIIIRSHPDAKVLIAGDGPFKEHLIMLCGMIGISNQVIFAGFRKDIKEILSAIDILAVPSLVDDYPMIAMEGMAMGKPVIATRIEGVEEQIIDGETGILVLSWDANVLAKAINRIIDDNVLAEGLGKKAREKVQKDFSAEKMISETGEIYRSLSQDCAC
jgi:glycosyltransferase involved in cell wall biosynthesis